MRNKSAVTLCVMKSKLAGFPELKEHKVGTKVKVDRHAMDSGRFVIWFGKRYATVDAIKLHECIKYE